MLELKSDLEPLRASITEINEQELDGKLARVILRSSSSLGIWLFGWLLII